MAGASDAAGASESLRVSPQASQPVRNEHKRGHKKEQDGSAIFGVAVHLARHAHEPQQARGLQEADERRRLQPPQPRSDCAANTSNGTQPQIKLMIRSLRLNSINEAS